MWMCKWISSINMRQTQSTGLQPIRLLLYTTWRVLGNDFSRWQPSRRTMNLQCNSREGIQPHTKYERHGKIAERKTNQFTKRFQDQFNGRQRWIFICDMLHCKIYYCNLSGLSSNVCASYISYGFCIRVKKCALFVLVLRIPQDLLKFVACWALRRFCRCDELSFFFFHSIKSWHLWSTYFITLSHRQTKESSPMLFCSTFLVATLWWYRSMLRRNIV